MQKFFACVMCWVGCLFWLSGCASAPKDTRISSPSSDRAGPALPDKTYYSQKDPRWGSHRMGGSGASMAREGCLVTAAAMAMTNLGEAITPGQLNAALKRHNGYTGSGALIWAGLGRASRGRITARYYNDVSLSIIDGCLNDGFYPMARFKLPNGRTHWSMIVRRGQRGFYMRDPLHPSQSPLLFPRGIDALEAVRCIGRA